MKFPNGAAGVLAPVLVALAAVLAAASLSGCGGEDIGGASDAAGSTGVAGHIILRSPCPVGGSTCPPPRPVEGTVRIEAVTGKGGEGEVVARATSDENGNYAAETPPGRYQLIAEKSGGYPVAKPSLVRVEAGVITQADVYLDSGIR